MSQTAHDTLVDAMPFARSLGVTLQEATPERVVASLGWTPERCTAGGVMHGGAVMTLADSAGALCAYLNLPEGATTSTVESKTNFFRAVTGGSVRAVAQPLHLGRTTMAVRTKVFDDDDRLVAHVVQTQAVIAPRGSGARP